MDNFHIIPDLAFQICELGGLTANANDTFSLRSQTFSAANGEIKSFVCKQQNTNV
jgi:hypothetical protein